MSPSQRLAASSVSPILQLLTVVQLSLAAVLLCPAVTAQMRDFPPDGGGGDGKAQAPSKLDKSSMSAAQKMVYEALQLQGGAERLAAVRAFRAELNVTAYTADGSAEVRVDETWSHPGKLRTRVERSDSVVETAWDGGGLRLRSNEGRWEKLTVEEAGRDYREVQATLRRIDRVMKLFDAGATFTVRGRRLARIYHTGERRFEFRRLDDPEAPKRVDGFETERRLSILEVVEVVRSDPKGGTAPLYLYINDTADHPTRGYVVGVSGRSLDGATDATETLWFANFLESDKDSSLIVPRELQIYHTPAQLDRNPDDPVPPDVPQPIQSFVEIWKFAANVAVKASDFSPR